MRLRGDPPKGEANFRPVAGGLRYASDLVSLIRAEFPSFGIAVAGYPEKHQEASSIEADLEHLRRKVDCGADAVITQLFYDNRDFFAFQDRCAQLGINVPIIPGLLPVTNLGQIQRITSLCGAQLPEVFVSRLAEKNDEAWQFEVGVEFAIDQVQELIDHGVPGIHFYVLNKSQATCRVLDAVSLPAEPTPDRRLDPILAAQRNGRCVGTAHFHLSHRTRVSVRRIWPQPTLFSSDGGMSIPSKKPISPRQR